MTLPMLKFLKLRIKSGLSRGLLLANIGAFTGADGTIGTSFGIEVPPGIAIESLQWTGHSKSGGSVQRYEAQMILAGGTTKLGPIRGSMKFGSAAATATDSSSAAFSRSWQQGITVGCVDLAYPIKLTERLALTLTARQLNTLSAGNPVKWEKQTYQASKGQSKASGRLGLTSNSNGDGTESPPPDPGRFLDQVTTFGLGLNLEIP